MVKKVKRIEANEYTWLFKIVYDDNSTDTYMLLTIPTGILDKQYKKVLINENDPKIYILYPVEDLA